MITRYPLLGLVSVLCALAVSQVDASEALSLSQAVDTALRCNPTVAAGVLSADAAKQAARGAKALANPELTIAPSVIGDAGADSALLISQPLEINGKRRVRGLIASHAASAASFEASSKSRDVVLQVSQSYWDVARAQRVVELSNDNIQYLESLQAAVQRQLDVGTVPGSQLIKTEVELARARQELAQARLELSRTKAELNVLLARPADTDFSTADPLDFREARIDKNALLSSAQGSRPEVSAARAELAAAQGGIRSARLARVPDVAVQARRESFEPDSGSGVALAVVFPVFDWGSIRSDVRRAESEARSREKQLEAARNAVSLDVEQAVLAVNTSSQVVREYQGGILGKSEELARMAQTGYEKGATSYLEVLEAQRTLRSTRTAYYSALADYAKSIAQLEWATGCSLPLGGGLSSSLPLGGGLSSSLPLGGGLSSSLPLGGGLGRGGEQ